MDNAKTVWYGIILQMVPVTIPCVVKLKDGKELPVHGWALVSSADSTNRNITSVRPLVKPDSLTKVLVPADAVYEEYEIIERFTV